MLVATRLSKRFGAKVLFDALDWQVGGQERIGLVGDNGAGKTTLLRILAGELEADDGSVHKTRADTLAYLPQEVPRHTVGSIRDRVKDGHAELVRLEADIAARTNALSEASAVDAPHLAEALTDAHLTFSQLGGDTFAGRVESILLGLGFARAQFDQPVSGLSGGWAMRVELGRLLVAAPDYLLMDEPTNHLDQASLRWLEDFLRNYAGTWIVISHDHAFLDRTVGSIAALTGGELLQVRGTYAQYRAYVEGYEQQQLALGQKRALQAAHLKAFIDRFGAKASKARQAKSKAKALDKLNAQDTFVPQQHRSIRIRMQVRTQGAQDVLRAHDLHFAYGTRPILRGASLQLDRGDRVAIVGANGAGKSTLLRLLGGITKASQGELRWGRDVQPFLFSQHQSEALTLSHTVFEEMRQAMPHSNQTQIRGLLGAFLFDAAANERRVQHLSGGEKSRLALAKMVAAPANLLLLDEPTNHLDHASRTVLQEALQSYNGTLVIISHEADLVEGIATRFVSIEANGTLSESFRMPKASTSRAAPPCADAAPAAAAPADAALSGGDRRRIDKEAARAQRQREKRVAQLEADIQTAEARIKAIDALLVEPDVFNDRARGAALLSERQQLEDDTLPQLLTQWEQHAS